MEGLSCLQSLVLCEFKPAQTQVGQAQVASGRRNQDPNGPSTSLSVRESLWLSVVHSGYSCFLGALDSRGVGAFVARHGP